MSQGNLNFLQQFKKQGIIPNQLYKGQVLDNKDELKLGRIKVKLGFMEGLEDKFVPWFSPRYPMHHGSNEQCEGSGSFSVPAVDSYVFVVFQSSSPYSGFYESFTVDSTTYIPHILEDYPNTHVLYKFLDGSIVTINTKTHELYMYNAGMMHVRVDGEAEVSVKGNMDIHVAGDFTEDIYGSTTINVKNKGKREREVSTCKYGNQNASYGGGSNGILTINIQDETVFNNSENFTINTKKSVFINTNQDINLTTTGNLKAFTEGNVDLYTNKETRVYSKKSIQVKTDESLNFEAKDLNIVATTVKLKTDDLHIQTSNQYVSNTEKISIKTDKLHVKSGTETVMDNVSMHGVVEKALSVAEEELKDVKVDGPKDPDKSKGAEKAEKGKMENGGPNGWFVKLAKILAMKRPKRQRPQC